MTLADRINTDLEAFVAFLADSPRGIYWAGPNATLDCPLYWWFVSQGLERPRVFIDGVLFDAGAYRVELRFARDHWIPRYVERLNGVKRRTIGREEAIAMARAVQ